MTETYLRDVLDLPESVHAGDFKIELTGGFTEEQTAARVREYVVTEQLRIAFDNALRVVRAGVRSGSSYAAYLHGSFGSGKSHFLTVLHAVLNNDPVARDKPSLQPLIAEHDEWMRDRRFLMVPYHLIGAADLDSALLGGYVATVRDLHPDAPVPPVYRSDAMLDDARRQREFLADDGAFARWLGSTAAGADDDEDLDVIGEAPGGGWTTRELDEAFSAPPGSLARRALESALLSGPLTSYSRGARGDAAAFVPLEDGLAIVGEHAKSLGYHGIVLFLDELILWLQAHMQNQQFVNTQVSKLVKLIESGVAERAVPIISFISRQRDLSKLIGDDVTGADVKNLEAQVEYLAGRFDVVSLEDSNLPAIVRERVLKPRPGKEHVLDEAFAAIESSRAGDRDVLLDATGVTEASWDDFRRVYPLSPALLNVLVVLAGALQRERTGLKLLQEMLHRRRDDMVVGQLIPLGDLWDVLTDGTGAAFTSTLRREAEAGKRFYDKARAYLLELYGSETDQRFVGADRFVKTLLLASLAREGVPALNRLTGARLAALNLGSIRSRTVEPGQMVVTRLRELEAVFGELRHEGEQDPVFTLHLSDLDVEPILDAVGEQDNIGARRIWVKDWLWSALKVPDRQSFVSERDHVWRGTKRTAEFVFGNVRDTVDVPELQFRPGTDGAVRFVFDYPFDEVGQFPAHDVQRVQALTRSGVEGATLVWIPHFLTDQRTNQLGRLIKINYLLDRNRLDEHAAHLSSDDRVRVRVQLQAQRDNLASQLGAAIGQAYGIAKADKASVRTDLDDGVSTLSLLPGHRPRLAGGAGFEHNVDLLADGLLDTLYPQHPDFDPSGTRKALTLGELRTVLRWITAAMENGDRRVEVASKDLALVRRVVHGLGLGEVTDGPLYLHAEWKQRIEQHAAAQGVTGDFPVDGMRRWVAELAGPGLDRPVANLVIATYALLADRAWVHHGVPSEASDLDRMGAGDALRAQELPGDDEFGRARTRAADLFGVTVPEPLFARNVAQLATQVQQRVAELESDVIGVWQALDKHAGELGLESSTGATANRPATARAAADLLATLSDKRDATVFVRTLAAGAGDRSSDAVLGAAIVSAPAVRRALDGVQWQLLHSARNLRGHATVGERAERLVTRVAEVAAADQFQLDLAPVLDWARAEAIDVVSAATAATPGTAAMTGTAATATATTEGSQPPTPSPSLSAPQSVRETERRQVTAATLGGVVAEIERVVRADPDARYEVTWRVVDGTPGGEQE